MSDKQLEVPMLDRVLQHPKVVRFFEICKRPIALRLACLVMILGLLRVVSEHAFLHEQAVVTSSALLGSVLEGGRSLDEKVLDINNSTLGFQRVFAIGMAERTDKRDTFSLIARLTGFDFQWVNGVLGDALSDKAIPDRFDTTRWKNDRKTIACWRAHMNVAQIMVNENIQTAFVFEDDADWDYFLRPQLMEYARAVTEVEALTRNPNTTAPTDTDSAFGDDWDLQWFGNCGTEADEKVDTLIHIIGEDPTAIPDALYQRNRGIPNFTPPALWESNYTRAILPGSNTWCTYGYGLSLRGAKRSLFLQSVMGHADAIDESFHDFCRDKTEGFTCHTAYPPLIGTHRPAGEPSRDSDREGNVIGGRRDKASTVSIVYSMILNAGRLLKGQSTVLSQWPGKTLLDEAPLDMELPRGRRELVTPDQYRARPDEPRYGGPRYEPPW